jgi:peptide-methionine (S)-S-oxide reductase
MSMTNSTSEVAIFGGGCFWCLEAVFDRLEGVTAVESGYAGGQVENPTYRQVCGGDTGHVEVVRVTFDPARITYRDLLDVFFEIHDPTTPNQQGNDVGEQYRSVIYYTTEEQREQAEETIAKLTAERKFHDSIVTTVESAPTFYVAEDYHQEYYESNRSQPYCMFVISPKVKKLEKRFAEKLRA